MRKVYTLILMLVVAMLAGSAWAQQPVSATMPVQQSGSGVADAQLALVQPRPISTSDLKAVSGDASVARQRAKAARKAVASIDDLTGNYVMTYKSLTTQLGDGGSSVTITKVTDDTVLIANFWTLNVNVKAKVDLQTKTITIPNQVAVVNNTYGDCDICAVNPGDGKPDRTKDVTGTIADDGTLNIDTWWGIYVKSGENADQFMVAAYGTQVTKANAKMDVTYYEDSNPASSWNVIVEQTGKNIVAVTNFGNHGKTVEIKLNSDSTITIAPQLAWEGGTTQGDFYTYAANWEGSGTYGGAISGKGTADELSWGQWVMFSTNRYYTGK
ncbi:MAG: hypothetical protein IJ808_02450, partial [Muribaculaceae bacterium]|nr:hypothetical protein [Muribaculaceae bacterium]